MRIVGAIVTANNIRFLLPGTQHTSRGKIWDPATAFRTPLGGLEFREVQCADSTEYQLEMGCLKYAKKISLQPR